MIGFCETPPRNHLINLTFSPKIFANPRPLLSSESVTATASLHIRNRAYPRRTPDSCSEFNQFLLGWSDKLEITMPENVNNELLYEILKKIQADVAHIKGCVDDHDQQFITLREQVHNLQGDILRIDRQGATVLHRLERIERRLELTEA